MFIVSVTDENGSNHVFENVLAYDCISMEDIRNIEEEMDIKLSEAQVQKIKNMIDKLDNFPTMDDLRWIAREVAKQE
jgi:hypothetical protein